METILTYSVLFVGGWNCRNIWGKSVTKPRKQRLNKAKMPDFQSSEMPDPERRNS